VFPVRRLAAYGQVVERGVRGYVAKDQGAVTRIPTYLIVADIALLR
jgi:hypothetical protein